MIEIGLTHTSMLIVEEPLTAMNIGSGNLPVLATPAMVALMENAAMLAIADRLPENCTTVGGFITSSHLRPSKLGTKVAAVATVIAIDGKRVEFSVKAYQDDILIGEGSHIRYIVDKDIFMSKIN